MNKVPQDPVQNLYAVAHVMGLLGWLAVTVGLLLVAASKLTGGWDALIGGGICLFFGYAGKVICRIAVCVEQMAEQK